MQTPLTVTALQTTLFWEEKEKNLEALGQQLLSLPSTDLIVLPEMFTTGFTMKSKELAETMEGPTVIWMRKMADEKKAAIAGSAIIEEQGVIYNRFLFVSPQEKEIQFYDKRHTFTLAGEHLAYATGQNKGIVKYKGWTICLRVCYDLRFPVWNRNVHDYDLLIFTANWPSKRIAHWDALLRARAIENMSYCIGVNRIGTDGSDLRYPGHSSIYDYFGNSIGETTPHTAEQTTQKLLLTPQKEARNKLKFLADKDVFSLRP